MLGYNNISNWYSTVNALRFYQKISDETIMNWIPFERDIYIELIAKEIKKKN